VGNVKVQNDCGDVHAVCQTMLPGYEDMLDGTEVPSGGSKTLAVPDTDYWLSTAAHYVSSDDPPFKRRTDSPYTVS
jgi:hypothetical protein